MCGLQQSYPKYIRLKGGRIIVNKKWIEETRRIKELREKQKLLKRLDEKKNLKTKVEKEGVNFFV